MNKKTLKTSSVLKKIFQVIAIILLFSSLAMMSYLKNVALSDLGGLIKLIIQITFVVILIKNWKNRKNEGDWFNWYWIIYLILISIIAFGIILFI